MASQVCSMNWNSPRADEVGALAFGSSADSAFAVASRWSKLAPVALAALRIVPAMAANGDFGLLGSTCMGPDIVIGRWPSGSVIGRGKVAAASREHEHLW